MNITYMTQREFDSLPVVEDPYMLADAAVDFRFLHRNDGGEPIFVEVVECNLEYPFREFRRSRVSIVPDDYFEHRGRSPSLQPVRLSEEFARSTAPSQHINCEVTIDPGDRDPTLSQLWRD